MHMSGEGRNSRSNSELEERFVAAMTFSAIGDAWGWPTEFVRPDSRRKPPFSLPLRDFVTWKKVVGGRWWGYPDKVAAGEYSDDTQLTLAVARCIRPSGAFDCEKFAYSELPLWLHYERGGGRSVKTAARALLRPNADYLNNFYRQKTVEYRNAGANGAAMRNLPIALVSVHDQKKLVRDSFLNSIITHGHPRAILGSILFGLAVQYNLLCRETNGNELLEYLQDGIEGSESSVANNEKIQLWIDRWNRQNGRTTNTFREEFRKTLNEALSYIKGLRKFAGQPPKQYYQFVGALSPETRGSGLATVCAALFLFLENESRPEEGVYTAVNMLGSDTDTIASFVGALAGARYGMSVVPSHLSEKLQDREYISKMARQLHTIATGMTEGQTNNNPQPFSRKEAYMRLLAWEIGLHEMFWDAIEVGGLIVHPTLGRGRIVLKCEENIAREGYVAKLLRVQFDCGQSCVFHSRVKDDGSVSGSLAAEVQRGLAALALLN